MPVAGTLPYAPPEVVNALHAGEAATVQPSHDIWSLGALAFECISQTPLPLAFGDGDAIRACAAGERPYPWEEPEERQAGEWVRAHARGALLQCLRRDPAARPSAAGLLRALAQINMQSTRAGAPQ